ncbi:hypothetical protein PAMC26577_36500 [Caballeronia sordidicola]|uniref:Uncharacterized protein n=1 Tax=Caballeronia sordidicola TaxID=196367 RepID=A0A242M846_CABSO|nr:hypothetical protein PAMC26577_36500 [Caballeronia sordidicola]
MWGNPHLLHFVSISWKPCGIRRSSRCNPAAGGPAGARG